MNIKKKATYKINQYVNPYTSNFIVEFNIKQLLCPCQHHYLCQLWSNFSDSMYETSVPQNKHL